MTNNNGHTDQKPARKNSLDPLIYGMLPPQDTKLERAILGAITLEKAAFDRVADLLHPACFYLDNHQRIFRAMVRLVQKNMPIDILTLVSELRTSGDLDTIGGPYGITALQDGVVSSANIEAHAKIVFQKYMKREIIRLGQECVAEGFKEETDAFDLLESAERSLSALAISQTLKQFETLGEVAGKAMHQIYAAKENGQELTGVPSGIPVLDSLTQGWQPTNLIILAARPGVGKSALAGNFAFNAATNKVKRVPVGLFSLEMSSLQWVYRLLSGSTQVPMFDMKRGRLDDGQMKRIQQTAMIDYANIPIYFDDTASLDIYRLKAKARTLVIRYKVGLIIVDYLQLMGGKRQPGENREQEVARISRELKQLAKELFIPIIALAQLSRQGEAGEPKLGHLRESGAIEQDADDVIFLSPVEEEAIQQDLSLKDSILLHIAKHRNGQLDKIPIKFVKGIQKLMTEQEYDRYVSGSLPPSAGWLPYKED